MTAHEALRALGIQIGMDDHQPPEWFTVERVREHILHLEERAAVAAQRSLEAQEYASIESAVADIREIFAEVTEDTKSLTDLAKKVTARLRERRGR